MICLHHDDKDGRGSAFIVFRHFGKDKEIKFVEMNYTKEIPFDMIKKDELVYIVDFSFTKNTVWQLEKLLTITKNVVWIDHHKSSIDLIKEMPKLNKIRGIRQIGISGMALTEMFFTCRDFNGLKKHIQLVSDYDCWLYKFGNETKLFNTGLDLYSQTPNDLESIWNKLDIKDNNDYKKIFNEIIEKGKVICEYNKMIKNDYLNKYGFESKINGYDTLVVNKKDNSEAFGQAINKYPLVCVFVFNGEKYTYSIYTALKDIECNKIAERFGGGGHPGAAGFTLDYNLFDKKLNNESSGLFDNNKKSESGLFDISVKNKNSIFEERHIKLEGDRNENK